nr:LOW QUALITY PROTEIN: interferon regulatory factor 8 [Microcebus murinus]
MCDRNGGRRLRQWLIEQIDSGMYPGLIWENDEKSMFRIPWKHAGKQDYNQEVDASIFKAWAVFKGKFKEGDKAEPATWKTRLRCALNKSPDFEEVTDRSQLDISEPYKVYRIVPEEEQKCKLGVATPACVNEVSEMECGRPEIDELLIKEPSVDDYVGMIKRSPSPPEPCRSQLLPDWWAQQPGTGLPLVPGYAAYDAHHSGTGRSGPGAGHGHCQGTRARQSRQSLVTLRTPAVLLTAAPRVDIRACWWHFLGTKEAGVSAQEREPSGNAVVSRGRPNKLERDTRVPRFFDTSQFFRELQQFYGSQARLPDGRAVLCFGEEFPDMAPLRSKLILVQVEQLYVRQLAEEAGKSCGAGSVMPAPEEPLPDQVFRMFPDICASHQRPFFRENQQITV